MLNKEICRVCVESFMDWKWTDADEQRWDEEWVWCPWRSISPYECGAHIFDDIPEWCPYDTEHVVSLEDAGSSSCQEDNQP